MFDPRLCSWPGLDQTSFCNYWVTPELPAVAQYKAPIAIDLCEFPESRTLGRVRKVGGKFHRKLNISSSPIANKYHEGKVKSTLKRELNVPEIVVNQAIGINVVKEL